MDERPPPRPPRAITPPLPSRISSNVSDMSALSQLLHCAGGYVAARPAWKPVVTFNQRRDPERPKKRALESHADASTWPQIGTPLMNE
jgi:hypothetical protein